MYVFGEILQNWRNTKRLKLRYQWLTWIVGACGHGLGLFLWYETSLMLAERLNVLLDEPANDVTGVWSLLYVVSIPIFLLPSGIVVAAAFGLLFVVLGQMKLRDVAGYALLSRFPRRWLRRGSGA